MAKSVPGGLRSNDSIVVDYKEKVVFYRLSDGFRCRSYSFENEDDLRVIITLLLVGRGVERDFEKIRQAHLNTKTRHPNAQAARANENHINGRRKSGEIENYQNGKFAVHPAHAAQASRLH